MKELSFLCESLDQLDTLTVKREGRFRQKTFDFDDQLVEGWFRFGLRVIHKKKRHVLDLAQVGVIYADCDSRYVESKFKIENCGQSSCLRGKSLFRGWLDKVEALAIKNKFFVRIECVNSERLLKILSRRGYHQEGVSTGKLGSSWIWESCIE